MNNKLYQTTNKEFNETERTIVHYISTAGVDEFGDVLVPQGMDDSRFKAVLWSHSLGLSFLEDRVPPPSELVIGKSLWRRADESGVIAKTEFASTPLANDVMRFNAEGYINSWSVGWKPKGPKKTDAERGITIYPKWYLYEYSSVIIPANPDAINLMLKEANSGRMKNILGREQEISIIKNDMMRYSDSAEKLVKEIALAKGKLNEIRRELDEIKNKMKGAAHIRKHNRVELINEAINKVFEEIIGKQAISSL